MRLNYAEIVQTLPHRAPMLLIDEVKSLDQPFSIVAIKRLKHDEAGFSGHFPGYPVYPGVLIVEAIAQAAALLAIRSVGDEVANELPVLTGIERARFLKAIHPGQELELRVKRDRAWGRFWRLNGEARVDGAPAASVTLMATMMPRPPNGVAPHAASDQHGVLQ
ncbi:3-hydroxyacyl-ACP dehydratase FabZ [Burkholderia sp. Bp8963]|uniref:3-hydroxyacyl-ACP dehydratase FabZ n=1 Tax=Burkholderia sp. Bp8963 TaxID=2184547 RepID=UPI000F5B5B0D|nr:3-hydroxyacyl-ACP dehydratase FabZ [Burkholderia sp. Bp8963]RQS64126.1 3-hydroxyacyl-ACP dehydratase FabZ [Burkholderia sp. Bp8963]